jgi:hypothetical protein
LTFARNSWRLTCPRVGLPNRRPIGDDLGVKTTRYLEEQVLRKRRYLRRE